MIRATLLLSTAFLCEACGYVGDTLPPALNLPARVTDLTASQRGSAIRIHFTMPASTTEGQPVKQTPRIDLRIGAIGTQFNEQDWLSHSRKLPAQGKKTSFETSSVPFAGKTVVIGVRLFNSRGKTVGWSNFAQLAVTVPLVRPTSVTARAVSQGVELTWVGVAPLFRVFRKDPQNAFSLMGDTAKETFIDSTAHFGQQYTYFVQGVQKVGANESESDVSDNVMITPKDVFPPRVPTNLRAAAGAATIELSWDRDVEPDLAGYRLYRAEDAGDLTLIARDLNAPSYSDSKIGKGTHYRYAVSAIDLSGNESARSEPVEAVLP